MVNAPVPARVEESVKDTLLGLVDHALEAGWSLLGACQVLLISPRRVQRWWQRRNANQLADARPGGTVNALMPSEVEAILELFDAWGEKDRSHRRLAHRGSYTQVFWASPSTVRRVLFEADKHFHPLPRPGKSKRLPFPSWADYTINSIWIFDSTHFPACGMVVLIIEDLVSRKWLTHVVSAEETHTQVRLGFEQALDAEDLLEAALQRADELGARLDPDTDDGVSPILLAVSDNGSQMIAGTTRKFMAIVAIAQHFGRPSTPTDQAWIESLNKTIKYDYPHLMAITDPAALRAELDVVQRDYNTCRLHSSIGYVTPDDEHAGRGPAIRAARREGLENARQQRLAYNRNQSNDQPNPEGPDAV